MIRIKELRALRGPNRYTRHTAIFMVLDIKEYEKKPSDKIHGFTDRLINLIPTLKEHGCSIGGPGGFVQRLKEGTWAGHIIEHIAIELQCLSGMEVEYGKTFCTSQDGIYLVVFRYKVESAGLMAAEEAVSIFESLAQEKNVNIEDIILKLKVLREKDMLGPTTWSIVKEAVKRGIPFTRLNEDSYIQLGFGANQKRIQASMTCQTSAIAVETADEKTRVKKLLKESGIPVPNGYIVSTLEEAIAVFDKMGGSMVVKPDVGNHGNGATINVTNIDQFKAAFQIAKNKHPFVIIERFIEGFDFRLLVINGQLIAAGKRDAACVIGDGRSTVKALIDEINKDPRRGFGHEKILTQIEIDEMTRRLLLLKGLSLESIPKKDEKVYLKTTANISQGGTATDVTDEVHPDIQIMSERVSKIIGLDCMGLDAIAKDISLPLNESGIHVVEVNATPGFRMHLEPTNGQAREVAKSIVDMLFPKGHIETPVIAVTGTNGKTTTSKLITHALKYSGNKVGLACTTGIEIDGKTIISGDYSGPEGAKIVLREPTVDHIVLEVARGGVVRRGLGINALDVGVLLNIGTDHMGNDWIDTEEDLRLVKSTVIEVVKESGTSVLNADDKSAMSLLDRARGNIILFSLDSNNEKIIRHIKHGGTIVTLVGRNAVIRTSELDITICSIEEIPITLGGIIDFNISNAFAAIGALYGLKLSTDQIRNGIMTFHSSTTQNPGRMNLFDFKGYKVLIDYGHNSDSVRALKKLLPRISDGRKVVLCHGTGSRTDEQIIDYGKALASVYDRVIVTDFDPRDRKKGETSDLVFQGLIDGGLHENSIELILNENEALNRLFQIGETGDLLVIQIDELEPIMSDVVRRHHQALYQA